MGDKFDKISGYLRTKGSGVKECLCVCVCVCQMFNSSHKASKDKREIWVLEVCVRMFLRLGLSCVCMCVWVCLWSLNAIC